MPHKPNLDIVIRRMTPQDISEVVRISLASFSTDNAFQWLYPTHNESPSALYRWFLTRTKKRLIEENCIAIVVEEECAAPFADSAKTAPRLIAFAFWHLHGLQRLGGEVPSLEAYWPFVQLERALLSIQTKYEEAIDRVVRRDRMALFRDVEYEAFADLGAHVHLGLIAVDPLYQGRGVGLRLVQWGTERCREEGVVVSLEASPMGRRTYVRAGFEVVEEKSLDAERGIEGVAMLWRPGQDHVVI